MGKPSGILWAGPVSDIGGYGNVSRNFLRALQFTNIPVQVWNTGPQDKELGKDDFQLLSNNLVPRISQWSRLGNKQKIGPYANLLNLRKNLGYNPVLLIHGTPESFESIDSRGFKKKIGITLFETDRIPAHWVNLCNRVDEIWVPTQFNYQTFTESGVDPSKVKIIHYPIDCSKYNNEFDSFPFPQEVKSFRFLYTLAFDYRKGLDLLIPSYCEEFSDQEDVSLVLKIYIPNWYKKNDVTKVISSFIPPKKNTPHIYLIIEKMPRDHLLSLYSSCSCYVSTEKASGWGMPQMEMMAMGKPVISINWGGPTEFMNHQNSFLIEPEKEMEPVHQELQKTRPDLYFGHKCPVVTKENVKKTMREAFDNVKKREEVATRAKADIKKGYSLPVIGKQIKMALNV